mmetsp:Transcript_109620/g.234248  ORF Transcript_109620/g.234248 Transcript_109620/m.234248 type:complete len:146 (-) Transcript_109620:49-486(-)
MEKVVGDIAQVSIQILFLHNHEMPHGFVIFSILVGILHGGLSLCMVLRECVQDEVAVQAQGLQTGTLLLPPGQSSPLGSHSSSASSSRAVTDAQRGSSYPVQPAIVGRSSSSGVSPKAERSSSRQGERTLGSGGGCSDLEIPDLL